jgi:FLVCR family feline leukemia virus subgroup C receptor-related protein
MVSFCALITFIINPIASIFANYILDNKGLKLGVIIYCVFVILGVSLRMLIKESFYFVIIGNALNAVGNIFLINCPPRFSAIWFSPS